VRACRDLRGIEALGFVADGDGKVRVGTLAGTLALSGCRFCTACVAVCPTGALADKGAGARARGEDLVPCRGACPAGIDVPEYVRRLAEGRRDEAVAVIREKVPFPAVLGRICTRPCETACRRGAVDAPVAICALKRFAADGETGLWRRALRPRPETGRKVAVVGAGPAGLTAAFHLRRQGHAVTVFEKRERAGGMLRCGVPAYRLPREVLDAEVQAVWDTGVEFRPGQALGRDFTLDGLLSGGFDAVFLAVGAQQGRPVAIDGADLPGVLQGLDFLRRVAGGEEIRLAGRVVVIGGGNTAVDAARTARRCGAAEVFLACLEAPEEMPAGLREIEAAVAEGVRILPSRGPGRILCRDGRAAALDLVECTGGLDAQGNFCPRFGERRECLPVDAIILAVGQAVEPGWAEAGGSIRMSGGRVAAEAGSGATGRPGVFAGGDVAAASGAAIDAIAAGRRAAAAIDRSLGGRGDIDEVFFERGAPSPRIGRDEGFAFRPREAEAEREPSERLGGFREVSLGLTAGQARRESRRCLQCDLRLWLRPSPPPPENLLPFDAGHIGRVPETEGVFRLLDAGRNVLSIRGAADLRRALLEALEGGAAAEWFGYEEDKMYTRRESELLQDYVQRHGRMPGGGGEDLEDLY
jgi:NADPH-dependent glutamate synthase beta subunit-like oxidoreductase